LYRHICAETHIVGVHPVLWSWWHLDADFNRARVSIAIIPDFMSFKTFDDLVMDLRLVSRYGEFYGKVALDDVVAQAQQYRKKFNSQPVSSCK
jgi:hypothetical protein